MRHSVTAALAALVIGSLVAAAQTPAGTAVIRGRVVAADTGLPLREAAVQLLSEETVRSGSAARRGTDARGAYEFTGLVEGVYRLIASPPADKPMYLSTDRGGTGAVTAFELAADEVRRDVDFGLPRAAAVGGRLSDQFGQPVAGAAVHVFARGAGGRLLAAPSAFAATLSDDHGRYRTWGLPAGSYYVRVEPRATLQRASPSREGYVRTYYPSAMNLAEAAIVKVRASEDLDNVDVRLDLTRTYQISGLVLDTRGRPAPGAEVRLDVLGERAAGTGQRQTTGSDGRFTFTNLVPAEYVIGATAFGDPSGAAGGPFRTIQLMAARPVRETIVSSDAESAALRLRTGGELAGTVATAEGATPPIDLAGLRIRALPADPADQALAPRQAGTLDARARFSVSGVLCPVVLRVLGLPRGWFLSSVLQGSQDVVDAPIQVVGSGSTVRVVVSNRGATLSGTVEDAAGDPVALRDVRVYPDDGDAPETWRSGLHRALTDRRGRFDLDSLAPGRYLVLSSDRPLPVPLDEDTWAMVREMATPVRLGEQERGEIRLRLVAWPY